MGEWVLIIVVGAYAHRGIAVDHIPFVSEFACRETVKEMATNVNRVASAWTISCHYRGSK